VAEDLPAAALTALLQRAALAPSAHNAQPWFAQVEGGTLTVTMHPTRALVAGDPSGRQNTISIGVFLDHLVTAAAAVGVQATVDYQCISPLDQARTRVRFVENDSTLSSPYSSYANAIERRHTNRGTYESELPAGLHELLQGAELPAGVALTCFTEPESKAEIGQLVRKSMTVALQLPAMRRELAELVSWESDGATDRGMYLESMMMSPSAAKASATPAAHFLLESLDATAEAAAMGENYATAPILLVLSTQHDGPQAWLDAGRALSRLLLQAADRGLAHCIAAGPVEVPAVVPRLRSALGNTHRPQVLFRVGRPAIDVGKRTGRQPAQS
jgi:nitroreductase